MAKKQTICQSEFISDSISIAKGFIWLCVYSVICKVAEEVMIIIFYYKFIFNRKERKVLRKARKVLRKARKVKNQ